MWSPVALFAAPPPPPPLRAFYVLSTADAASNPPRAFDFPATLDAASTPPPAPPLSSLTRDAPRVTACARRCVPGCIRGGAGAPGLGPLTLRQDPVVFKAGFRSRGYCLSECTRVCSLVDAGARKSEGTDTLRVP